jgi:hypothetical protein
MVMEAMRLSLLDHEQQQQRQREEEERNRRNGETSERGRSMETGNNASLNVPSSGQRSSSVAPPEAVGERIDHRPSSSAPNNNTLDGLQASGTWRRSPSPFSTLVAALDAANAASTILSTDDTRPPPLSSSTTQTGGTDGDTATISSESSGTGHSSAQHTPAIDGVDGVEGDVNYATLPSSPESPGQPYFVPARAGDNGASSRRTPE